MTRQQELTQSVKAITMNSVKSNNADFSKRIYRSNGFEAFVVGETDTNWLIDDNNGVRCKVFKSTTKNSIVNVSADYQLRRK